MLPVTGACTPRTCGSAQLYQPVTATTPAMNKCMQVELAVKLGLPLLAPHPSIARHFSLKTGARQLFRSAKVPVAPGAELTPRAPATSQTHGEPVADQCFAPSGATGCRVCQGPCPTAKMVSFTMSSKMASVTMQITLGTFDSSTSNMVSVTLQSELPCCGTRFLDQPASLAAVALPSLASSPFAVLTTDHSLGFMQRSTAQGAAHCMLADCAGA